MRTIFIGDVHGCIEELARLVCSLRLEKHDRVVFVGDLVDKGPESLQVLRYVECLLGQFPGSVCVAGNHEEKALRFSKRDEHERLRSILDLKQEPWTMDAKPEDWAFVESMPLVWSDPTLNVRVVHGGVFPVLLQKHPDAWDAIEKHGKAWHKGGGKLMDRARRMLRTRYVGGPDRPEQQRGEMISLGENVPSDPFWTETYTGPTVIYGHEPYLDGQVKVSPHAIGVDTGCVFGGKLTALVYHEQAGAPESPEVVQVAADRKYAEHRGEES